MEKILVTFAEDRTVVTLSGGQFLGLSVHVCTEYGCAEGGSVIGGIIETPGQGVIAVIGYHLILSRGNLFQ